jgi:hypothetical protein
MDRDEWPECAEGEEAWICDRRELQRGNTAKRGGAGRDDTTRAGGARHAG